jgi:hypothetical protein
LSVVVGPRRSRNVVRLPFDKQQQCRQYVDHACCCCNKVRKCVAARMFGLSRARPKTGMSVMPHARFCLCAATLLAAFRAASSMALADRLCFAVA